MVRIPRLRPPVLAFLSLLAFATALPVMADARTPAPQSTPGRPAAGPAKTAPAWRAELAAATAPETRRAGFTDDDKRKLLRAGGMFAGGLVGLALGLALKRVRGRGRSNAAGR